MDLVLDTLRWESLEAGNDARVREWLVSDNEHVVAGQLLARAELVHETVDLVAPHAGCIEDIVVPAGERFGRGQVLARLVPF